MFAGDLYPHPHPRPLPPATFRHTYNWIGVSYEVNSFAADLDFSFQDQRKPNAITVLQLSIPNISNLLTSLTPSRCSLKLWPISRRGCQDIDIVSIEW